MVKRQHSAKDSLADDYENKPGPSSSRDDRSQNGGAKKTKLDDGERPRRDGYTESNRKPSRYIPMSTRYKRTKLATVTRIHRSLDGRSEKIESETLRESASRIFHH
uniref:Uncharacterized protein n=1 Tax=Anopheles minimus TaxID=112268 RepID=A0A182WPM6_9DIPT